MNMLAVDAVIELCIARCDIFTESRRACCFEQQTLHLLSISSTRPPTSSEWSVGFYHCAGILASTNKKVDILDDLYRAEWGDSGE